MLTHIRSLALVLLAAGSAAVLPVHAEEWTTYNVGSYRFHAPSSWSAFRGDEPNSAIVVSSEPVEFESYFLVDRNTYGTNKLPGIPQTWEIFRKVAAILGCSYKSYPDSGGRPIAGQNAIGAYAPCTNSEVELRVYVTTIPNSQDLLIVIHRYARRIMFDSEAYRYALLDAIVLPKEKDNEPTEGRYLVDGIYGGSSGGDSLGPAYMGWLTIEIQPNRRYRMIAADVIGSSIDQRAVLNEAGKFVVDGDQLILFSDAAPSWPAHDNGHQVPRRIRLRR